MMLIYIAGYILLSVISTTVLLLIAKYAPLGYEDENGFHYGRPEDKE